MTLPGTKSISTQWQYRDFAHGAFSMPRRHSGLKLSCNATKRGLDGMYSSRQSMSALTPSAEWSPSMSMNSGGASAWSNSFNRYGSMIVEGPVKKLTFGNLKRDGMVSSISIEKTIFEYCAISDKLPAWYVPTSMLHCGLWRASRPAIVI